MFCVLIFMSSTSENNKRIAKNTLFLYVRMLFIMGVTLYTSRVVLEVLGVEDFGIYNVVGGVVIMFSVLNGAMGASTSRFITIELGKKDFVQLNKVYSVSLVNHVLIGLFIFVLSETLGLWFLCNKLVIPEHRLSATMWAYQFSILSTVITLMQTPFNALIIAHEKMQFYALGSILDSLLKLSVVFLLKYGTFDRLILYAMLLLGVVVIMFFFYFIACRVLFRNCRFELSRDFSLYRTMLGYSSWDLIGHFSVIAQGEGLNILLNIFFGPTVNAARGISFQVQGAVRSFGTNFMMASRPQIIKYYALGEKGKMINLVFLSSKYSFFLLWIFTLPLLIEMDTVLSLWLNTVPDQAALFARIAMITGLITAWRNPFIAAMHATGKIKVPNIVCGTLLIMTLPVSYLFLRLGFDAASVFVIALIITFINMWVEWALIKRAVFFSIRDAIKQVVLKSCLVAFLSGAIVFLLIDNFIDCGKFYQLLITVLLSVLSVISAIYTVGINKDERIVIKDKIKKIIRV